MFEKDIRVQGRGPYAAGDEESRLSVAHERSPLDVPLHHEDDLGAFKAGPARFDGQFVVRDDLKPKSARA
jgi:hypothetical protein